MEIGEQLARLTPLFWLLSQQAVVPEHDPAKGMQLIKMS